MAIKTRNELEKLFKNGLLPTAQDFLDLFESMLNRKDDGFFGKWRRGTTYCHGAMVLHCGSLFILSLDESDDDCNKKNQEEDCEPCDDESPLVNGTSKCICSTSPPDTDARWKPLTVKVQDDDWVVKDKDGDGDGDLMYSNETVHKIGIGTRRPKAKLHVKIEDKGAFLFDPLESKKTDAPVFMIRTESENSENPEVQHSVVRQNAWWHTNASGFAFRKKPDDLHNKADAAADQTQDDPELLVRITTTHRDTPAIGIGTSHPRAALHAKEKNEGEIKLQPAHKDGPYLSITELAGSDKNYFKASVENKATVFRTKEGSSYFFRHVEAVNDYDPCNDERPAVAINPEGKVGIGTEKPASHLDIVDKVYEKGRFRLSFEEKNPALAIINTRPREETNYMALGVDNNRGVIVTDSPHGLEIKTGSPCFNNNKNNEVNINQDGGETLLSIYPDARVGIGKHPDGPYALDVKGDLTASGIFLPADSRDMRDAESLDGEEVLAGLKKLDPIKFNWKNGRHHHHGRHHEIGLRAKDVDEVFPQVVQSNKNQPESIAYQNLVAVLVAAVNRLSERVEELERRKS